MPVEHQSDPARAARYELTIEIDAPPARVWRGLTDQLGAWWLPDFRALGPDSLVSLEPRAGGHFVETAGQRQLLWFQVHEISPHQSLTLIGHCTPRWGGPLTTMVTFTLEETARGTRLRCQDALFGLVTDASIESLSSGWRQLLETGLRPWCAQ